MKKILVPSDFSENSTTALIYAIELARQAAVEIVIFHCMLPPFGLALAEKTQEEKDALIKSELEQTCRRLQRQVDAAYRKLGIAIPAQRKSAWRLIHW